MKLHFAGADANNKYNEILKAAGAVNRLESYHSLKGKAHSSGFETMLIDSGGFVARSKGVPIDVKKFAAYLNFNEVKLAFELDTNSVKETLANRDYLMSKTKTQIIPVFHYDRHKAKDLQVLLDLVDNFEYIAIGGVVGAHLSEYKEKLLYDRVFSRTQDKVKVHGLGTTTVRILKAYPFYSVDSTSWLAAARYGNFKSLPNEDQAEFRKKNRHYLDNTAREVKYWLHLEKYITGLWAQKGITWQ